ncbi:hypothetical protein ACVBEF_13655 [Glaciimonas sp. GG7]
MSDKNTDKTADTKAGTQTDTNAADSKQSPHQSFSWINAEAKHFPLADFAAITSDVCHGIHACLDLVGSNAHHSPGDPARANSDARLPPISAGQVEALHGLMMGASLMLRDYAEREIAWINAHGPGYMQAMKGAVSGRPE